VDLLTGSAANGALGVPAELGDPTKFQFAESHNLLGIAYLEQAKYAEAEAQFELAILKAPHWAYPRHNLALTYVEHGNYSGAESEYREAIRWTPVGAKFAEPKNPCFQGRKMMVSARPYLYYNLGVLLQRVNRLAEAQKAYCMAEVSFRYQMELFASVRAESNADLATLAELRSKAGRINLADVNNSLGVLFETRSKKSQAAAQFQKALSNNAELSAASFNLARLNANKALAHGNTPAARATASKGYQDVLDKPFCRTSNPDLGCQAARSALKNLITAGQ
jgi:tetratricopeptide (TPR) repeat protein